VAVAREIELRRCVLAQQRKVGGVRAVTHRERATGVAAACQGRHYCHMGSGRNPSSIKPDLFSAQQLPDSPSLSATETKSSPSHADEPTAASSPSYALPTNLPSALRHLDNDQLERLLAAVIAERQARGGKKLPVSDEPLRKKKRIKEPPRHLTLGKLNAVRAAFKAGITPSRIARQFGVSKSDVRKALASDPPKTS
jgi:hypothetical protein